MRKRHVERRLDHRRPRREHDDAVGQMDRLFDVVRDQQARVPFGREDPPEVPGLEQRTSRRYGAARLTLFDK